MIPQMSQVSDKAMAYKIQLERPPATAVELWHLVNAMWGVKIPDQKKCSEHVSPFHAFSDAYFAKDPNWALWYGSRGCLAGDSLITVNRAGNSVKRRMDRFVPRFNNTMVELEGQLAGGRAYRTDIQTKVQRADGEYARLGVVGTAYSSGVKHTYELVTETGRKIRATAEHPFATADGFIPLGELTVGSSVLVNRGKSTSGRRAKQRYARVMAKYHPQATKGQYWVHRLVVEAQLNQMAVEDYLELLNTDPHAVVVLQFLPEGMHVHHLNGDPLDNRAENLLPMTEQQHHQLHADSGKTSHVLDRIGEERIADIRSHGPEPTYDLTMANGPNNYIANGFVVHNTGKSYMLATLALTKAVILEINVTLLGGSMAQSVNVREHVDSLLRKPNAPRFAVANHISTEILFNNGNWIRPLPASQTTVRGPHPHATMLDEIDEMEKKIYDAAQGQAMALPNHLGIEIPEMTVASSTWQNPAGCVAVGTKVTTASGEVNIEQVTPGDQVLTRYGYREVLHSHDMGLQPTVEVTFAAGNRLVCTPWHPVWTDSDGWVRADSLAPGALACLVLPVTQPAHQLLSTPFAEPDGLVASAAEAPGLTVGPANSRSTGVVGGSGHGLQMSRVDASLHPAQVVDDQTFADGAVQLLVDPTVRQVRALGLTAAVLHPVAAVVEAARPQHAVVGVEVEGFTFVGDEVVGVHTGMVRPTWDLTVAGAHEYVAAGVLTHNTFTDVMREARSKGLPIHSWCWREVIRNAQQPHGWMDPGFIERKRASVPAEMFRVEYELGEPSGEARAFDLEAVNHTFTQMDPQQEFHRGNDDEWVFEAPEPGGVYAAGADWAKERDKTVLVVQRTDVTPWKLVYVRIFNKRPWPYMIGEFNSLVSCYSAVSAHDATGLGNVVHDMVDERTIKVVMVGQDRTKLLTEYIAALEQGRYTMARNTPLYAAHADTTVDDVFGAARWNTHLADEVAACAIAHRAATRMAGPSAGEIVKRSNERPVWLQKVDPKSNSNDDSFEYVYDTGVVSVSQGSDDVGVFWL